MAPRAYWKGYLKLSLVSCPIALYPATSEQERFPNRVPGLYTRMSAGSGLS